MASIQQRRPPLNAGQTYQIDQMYVQYQIPVNARKLPLVLCGLPGFRRGEHDLRGR
jgi:hypothetical protein